MALAVPPNSSHKVLFVGAPVKIRETPELAELEASNPYTNRAIPTTINARPIPLFIWFYFYGCLLCE
jgi:hypothetical protein